MSGPSHGSPVCDSLWKENDQSPTTRRSATSAEVSSSSSRYGSPASRMRAGSEWAVKTTCGSSSPATVRTRRASAATKPGSAPQRRTKRVSARPATASSKSASYFAIDIVEKCGARTSPTSRSASPASASSTAVAMRGSQWRMPVQHRQPELRPERGARRLGDGVERRGRVGVVDPERAVAVDEVVEQLPPDRPAAADVGVVGRDVREPVGRAVRHQDHRRRAHAATVMRRALAHERGEPRQRPGRSRAGRRGRG